MKFQVGDKVLVLHSEEEGEVVDIINDKMVMVDVRGVKFPAYTDQLDFPYFRRFMKGKQLPSSASPGSQPPSGFPSSGTPSSGPPSSSSFASRSSRPAASKPRKFIDDIPKEREVPVEKEVDGVWLTFIPVTDTDEFGDEIVDLLKIHLVNRTETGFRFEYTLNYTGKEADFGLVNEIHSFRDFYIHDMPFENLNDGPSFSFVFSLLKPEKNRADQFETQLKLRPRQVFTRIQEIRQKGEATFSYKLLDRYPDKQAEEPLELSSLTGRGYKVYSANAARQHLEPAKHEIDLHIEKLSPHPEQLSNFEMLTLQLNTLEKYLDLAVAHHQPSMIIIHGVGKGKLRDETHELLRLRHDVKSFVNRYHPAYGYGATEVFFQY